MHGRPTRSRDAGGAHAAARLLDHRRRPVDGGHAVANAPPATRRRCPARSRDRGGATPRRHVPLQRGEGPRRRIAHRIGFSAFDAVVAGGDAVERALRVDERSVMTATARSSTTSSANTRSARRPDWRRRRATARNARRLPATIVAERRVAGCCRSIMEEARPHRAVGLDHHRHPRRVARHRRKRLVAGERRVVARQPPQLLRRLGDEPRLEVVARSARSVARRSPRTRATSSRSSASAVGCATAAAAAPNARRRHVGRQERDAVERHRLARGR